MSNSTEFISGRSRERAKQLIQLAEDAGLEATVIHTDSIRGGYLVPQEVADAYAGDISATDEDTAGQDRDNTPSDGDNTPSDGDNQTPSSDAAAQDSDGQGVPAGDAGDQGSDAEDPMPAGNASQSVWADWAKRNKGYDESEGLTRDQLKQRFGA